MSSSPSSVSKETCDETFEDFQDADEPVDRQQAVLAFATAMAMAFQGQHRKLREIRQAIARYAPDIPAAGLDGMLSGVRCSGAPNRTGGDASGDDTPPSSDSTATDGDDSDIWNEAHAEKESGSDFDSDGDTAEHDDDRETEPDSSAMKDLAARLFVIVVSLVMKHQRGFAGGGGASDMTDMQGSDMPSTSSAPAAGEDEAKVAEEWLALPGEDREAFAEQVKPALLQIWKYQRKVGRQPNDSEVVGIMAEMRAQPAAVDEGSGGETAFKLDEQMHARVLELLTGMPVDQVEVVQPPQPNTATPKRKRGRPPKAKA